MPNPLVDHSNRALIARILRENFPAQKARYAVAIAAMVVIAGTTALSAWLIGDVIDGLVQDKDRDALIAIAALVVVIFVVKGLASFVQAERLARVGNAIVAEQQRRIYDRILHSDLAALGAHGTGDLIVRVTHNAVAVRNVINMVVTTAVRDVLTLFGLVVVMLVQQPWLTVIALVGAPPAIFGVNRLIRRVRRVAEREFVSLTELTGTMQETVRGVRVVKAFNLESRMQERMGRAVSAVESRANRIAKLEAATSPIMETVGGIAIALAVVAGAITMTGETPLTTPGALMSFVTALLLAYDPAKRLARLGLQLEKGLVGARLMYELIDAPLPAGGQPDLPLLTVTAGAVRFEEVRFDYTPRDGLPPVPALDGLSVDLRPGTVTALVGPSGSGKSTVMNLLLRFYEPRSGRITIDGTDIAGVATPSVRAAVAYVGQDTFLFDGTVRANIALGRDAATEAEIEAAAEAADALGFIRALPGGMDAMVGEGGESLSGGQRQRIAIARAFLKDAPIIALDEATSALDSHAEAAVQRAMARLLKGRTALVIAHRLSTIRAADTICVMEAGRIVERGTHAELLERRGRYAALHELQFAA